MNVELLEKVKQHIINEPQSFEMGNWCGSACCIAGWTCVLAGATPHYRYPGDEESGDTGFVKYNGDVILADQLATILLDISRKQSAELFLAQLHEEDHKLIWSDNRQESVEAAVSLIDDFIKTYSV